MVCRYSSLSLPCQEAVGLEPNSRVLLASWRTSARLIRRYVGGRIDLIQQARRPELKDVFLAAEISERADVGDDEGGGEAVFGADLTEVDAAVFESEAAAVSVVADLHELALQDLVGEIVANAGGEIESLARQVSVAH